MVEDKFDCAVGLEGHYLESNFIRIMLIGKDHNNYNYAEKSTELYAFALIHP